MSSHDKYTISFSVADTDQKLYVALQADRKGAINKRAGYELSWENGSLKIDAFASDAVACKAVLNGILKNLLIFEQMEQL